MFNKLKFINTTFKNSEIVIAIDSKSWRKVVFKYYKANRVLARVKSKQNMEEFYEYLNTVLLKLEKYFPFKCIRSKGAEADDIIATLSAYFKNSDKQITIISRDRDFMQLQRFNNVQQYDPITNNDDKFVRCDDPYHYLQSHIISGDRCDSICNILSPSDTFVTDGGRQKQCGSKRVEILYDIGISDKEEPIKKFIESNATITLTFEEVKKRYEENRLMVELSEEIIPSEIQDDVIFRFNNYKKSSRKSYMKLIEFFAINPHLNKLGENVFDFM